MLRSALHRVRDYGEQQGRRLVWVVTSCHSARGSPRQAVYRVRDALTSRSNQNGGCETADLYEHAFVFPASFVIHCTELPLLPRYHRRVPSTWLIQVGGHFL
jgi:hypothetical protein